MVINRDRHNKYSVDGYLSYSNADSTTTTTQGTTDNSQQSSGSTGGGGGSTTIIYQGGSSKPAFNQVNVGQNAIVATNNLTAFGITGSGKIQVSLENNVITITYVEDEPTDQYWQVDEEGNLYTTRNVYSTQEISAYGLGEGGIPTGGASYLYELKDVDLSSLADQSILQYNNTTQKWEATDGSTIKPDLSDYATITYVDNKVNVLSSTINAISQRVISLEDMFEWDGDRIKAKADLYGVGEISAYGYAEGEIPTGAQYLSELKDVDLTNIANQGILQYNSNTRKWEVTDGSSIRPDLTGYATQSWVTSTLSSYATQAWVTTQINNLIGTAPDVLDTIYEIAAALNNDPDFVKDIANNLANLTNRVTVNETDIAALETNLDALTNRVVSLEDMFEWDNGKIKAKADLYGIGEIAAYGYSEGEQPTGAQYLHELKDVTLTDLAANQLLQWNGSKWVNINKDEVGLNESELAAYLTANNYVTESYITWDNIQNKPVSYQTEITKIIGLNSDWANLLKTTPTDYVTRWPSWSEVTNKPTTLAGFGITDVYSKTDADGRYVNVSGDTMTGELIAPTLKANTRVQIGDAYLEYDSANKAIKVRYKDDTAFANLYATGEVSAYNFNESEVPDLGASSLSELDDVTLTSLTTDDMLIYRNGSWVNIPMSDVAPDIDLSNVVTIDDTQTITGQKTFSSPIYSTCHDGVIRINYDTDTSRYLDLVCGFASDGTTQIYSVGYHNTAQKIILNPIGSNNVWEDAIGKYSLVIGNNLLRYNTYNILHVGNFSNILDSTYAKTDGTNVGSVENMDVNHVWNIIPRIFDVRSTTRTPNLVNDKSVEFWFNNTGMPESDWYAAITVKGWTNGYSAWQLAGYSGAGSISRDLYYRVGIDATWDSWRKLLDTGNYTITLDSRYVKKSGDTMTGVLTLPNDKYYGSNSEYAINLRNSDIINVNSIWTADVASAGEGIHFMRSNGNWDNLTASDGVLYFATNQGKTASTIGDKVWHAGNDGSGSGLDADTVDGVHNGNLAAAVLNSQGRSGMITGKPTKTGLQMFDVYNGTGTGYPTSYGNLLRLRGGVSSGCGELLLGWSGSNNGIEHIYYRNNRNMAETWSDWRTVAFTTDNVASATKLATPRTIWGQTFDGTGNVSGEISNISGLKMTGTLTCAASGRWGYVIYNNIRDAAFALEVMDGKSWSSNGLELLTSGNIRVKKNLYVTENIGIGTESPAHKLHVSGDAYTSGYFKTDGWFQNNTSSCGLYNSPQDARWYASGGAWNTDKPIIPKANNLYSVGTSSYRFNYGYFTSMNVNGLTVNGTSTFNGQVVFNNNSLFNNTPIIQSGAAWIYYGDSNYSKGRIGYDSSTNYFWIQGVASNGHIHLSGRNDSVLENITLKATNVDAHQNFTASGNITAYGEVTAYYSSDKRLKENIQKLTALSVIRNLQPVSFDWTEEALTIRHKQIKHDYGLIAQEVEEYLPDIVGHDMYRKGYLGIDYTKLIPFALAGIKEVDSEVTRLKQRVEQLEQRLSKYESIV